MMDPKDIGRIAITAEELGLSADVSLDESAAALLRQQRQTWPTLRENFDALARVQVRELVVEGLPVRIQFNPGRLTSSAANVDAQAVRERKCFLCLPHLPPVQRGIPYGPSFVLLGNPFPIFPEHFTIPHVDHVPQRFAGEIGTFLGLARDLAPRYAVFYNGPRCGASAPDHLHFQAGTRHFMPLEGQYARLRAEHGHLVQRTGVATVHAIEGRGRRFIAVEGADARDVEQAVASCVERLQQSADGDEEAMMNIIAWYDAPGWTVLVFPRAKHRPSFYFAEGEERLLISPAAVDLGGVSITPLEADFHKVTPEHLSTMLREILMPADAFAHLFPPASHR